MNPESTAALTDLPIAWRPTPEYLERSRLKRFMEKQGIADYEALLRWSIAEPAAFWDAVMRDLDLRFYEPFVQVLDQSRGVEWTTWFRGGKFNYVHNALDKWVLPGDLAPAPPGDEGNLLATHEKPSGLGGGPGTGLVAKSPRSPHLPPSGGEPATSLNAHEGLCYSDLTGPGPARTAVIWEGDDGAVRELTFAELAAEVSRAAAGLREMGVRPGDRVGIFMPMVPETVVATLAVNKIGAAYVPIFSGYGPSAVAQRLRDAEARFLITADGFLRRGKTVAMKEVADAALAEAPGVERVVVVSRLGRDCPWSEGRDLNWRDLTDGQPVDAPTERTDPEDPCLIIYTSGTTGRPKGAVHPHCGFPVKAAQDMAHLFDIGPGDRLFWFTDLGWMMGPWAIMGSLMLGAACVVYEGAPDFPHPGRVWEMVDRHRITALGISPTAIRALMAHGPEVPAQYDLSSLRILGGTGEPWNPASWSWYFEHVGRKRCPIINYSGGTEISGGILGCVTLRPIKPCSFNTPAPGMAVDVLDEQGKPVRNEVGELVITNAWPGMTRGFWRDEARYEETYWSRWPGVWVHGDWALRDDEGFWYILGRSDDTIKVAGKRVGPAEVESAACSHPGVREAAAIGVPDELKGEALVVFAVLNAPASDQVRREITERITAVLGKTLKPQKVLFAADLPKTRNAKVLRRLIRAVYLGQALGDTSSLENPATLEAIRSAA